MTIGEETKFAELQDVAANQAIQIDLDKRIIQALSKALRRYISRQRIMHLKAVAKGRCKRCGKPAVTKYWCRDCADRWNDYQKHGAKELACPGIIRRWEDKGGRIHT
jgi:hypothetical protein